MSKRIGLLSTLVLVLAAGSLFANGALAKPAAGKTFVYLVPTIPTHLGYNPFEGAATQALYTVFNSRLINYDVLKLPKRGCSKVPGPTDVDGNLAASWTIKKNKSITIKLRNVKSAFGNPLTSEDVRWSFERVLNEAASSVPASLGTTAQFNIDNLVTIIDKHTIRLNLKRSTSLDIMSLTNLNLTVWDSTEAKKHATAADPWADRWFQTNTADFGPWKVASFTPGQEIDLVRNPYWKGEMGNITRVVMRAVPDATARAQLLKSGDANYAANLTPDQYGDLAKTKNVTVTQCVSAVRHWLGLNEKDPRLADVRVRQAISYAIDRKALVNVVYHGIGRPARFGLSQFFTFPQPPPNQQFRYDPAKAKSLLAAAGYPNGFKLEMIYNLSRPGPVASSLAVLLKTMLAQVGIDVDLRLIAGGADFTTAYTHGNYQSAIYSENAVILDPTFNAANFTNNGSPNDSINFNNAQWDAAMNGAKFSAAGSPQQAQYLAALARLGVSQVPIVYLADVFNPYAFSSNVTGLVNDPTGSIFPNFMSIR